ncbi:hypothetical protein VTK26DRAFT_5628 [Humicola hyalothermophila]
MMDGLPVHAPWAQLGWIFLESGLSRSKRAVKSANWGVIALFYDAPRLKEFRSFPDAVSYLRRDRSKESFDACRERYTRVSVTDPGVSFAKAKLLGPDCT